MPTSSQSSTVVLGPVTILPGIDSSGATDVSAALLSYIASVPNGTTIDFGNGTYRINSAMTLTGRDGLAFRNGNFICDLDETQNPPARHWQFNSCTNMNLSSMTMRGGNAGGVQSAHFDFEGQAGFAFSGGAHNTMANCAVSYVYGDGLTANSGTDDLVVTDFTVHDIGRLASAMVGATNLIYRRWTVWNTRHAHFDFEPLFSNQTTSHIEIDHLSYGTIGAPYTLIADGSGQADISDIWIHDSSPNSFGTVGGPNLYRLGGQAIGGSGTRPNGDEIGCTRDGWLIENNVFVAPAQDGTALFSFSQHTNLTIRNNTLAGNSGGSSYIADLISCPGAVLTGNTITPGSLSPNVSYEGRGHTLTAGAAISTGPGSNSYLISTAPGLQISAGLDRWRAARDNAGVTQAVVNVFGGSLSAGWRAFYPPWTDGWTGRLRSALQTTYGDTGEGYFHLGGDYEFSRVTRTGVTSTSYPFQWNAQGATANITCNLPPCSAIDIWYFTTTPVAARYTIDGGSPITVNPANISVNVGPTATIACEHVTGLDPSVGHTLVLLPTASNVLVGYSHLFTTKTRASGVLVNRYIVQNVGALGSTDDLIGRAATTSAIRARHQDILFNEPASLLILNFGMGEYSIIGNPAITKANLKLITDRQTAAGGCTLLLIDPYAGSNPTLNQWTGAPVATDLANQNPYHVVMRELAYENPHVSFIDVTAHGEWLWNDVSRTQPYLGQWLTDSGAALQEWGHMFMSRPVIDALTS